MVLRSVLFVPGSNPRMISKARTLPADALALDLEDAVALPEKASAREILRDSLATTKNGGASLIVRINALPTGLAGPDLDAVVCQHLDCVMMPKAESSDEVQELAEMLTQREDTRGIEAGSIGIIPLLETAKGIMNSYQIAAASRRVAAVAFGAGDFMRDLGRNSSFLTPDQTELLYARSQTAIGARAAGIQALDTVYFGQLTDLVGLEKEANIALTLGFKGKAIIHPSQIDIVNRVFSPSESETEYAKALVATFEEAERDGRGAVSFQGKMIDYMSYEQAKSLVVFATTIAEADRQKAERA